MNCSYFRKAVEGFGSCGLWCRNHRAHAVLVFLMAWLPLGATADPIAEVWPPVAESHAMSAHRLIEQWVQRGGVPGERAGAIRTTGLLGVRVTLRAGGITLGTGTALRADRIEALAAVDGGDVLLPATDLVTLLEAATTHAMDNVMARLKDRVFEARLRAQVGGDIDTQATDRSKIGAGLEVDLQIALNPKRLVIREDESSATVYARFAPGFHGLWVNAQAEPGMLWPATALAGNLSPRRQVMRLLDSAGLDAADSSPLGRPGKPGLYRFDVLHVVRPRAGLTPVLLVRGGKLGSGRFVNQEILRSMAEKQARHLLGRFIGQQRVRGSYHPSSGRYDPELADELEATLASLAIMRYARAAREQGENDPLLQRFENAGAGVVNRVAGRLLALDDLDDAVICGLAVLAMLDAPAAAFEPALRDRLVAKLVKVASTQADADGESPLSDSDSVDSEADSGAEDAGVSPPAEGAVVAAALAGRFAQNHDPALGQVVADALTDLWAQTDGRFDVFALPWAAEAHWRSAALLVEAGLLDAETAAARSATLAAFVDLIDRRQVVERPVLGPSDVMGGIVLRNGPEGSPPMPSWQTAQVLRFLATALRDDQVVSSMRRAGVMVTASAAARFLGQLMIGDAECFAVPSPAEARGGVRLAFFDHTLDVAPTALTLMAFTQLNATLHAMGGEESQLGVGK